MKRITQLCHTHTHTHWEHRFILLSPLVSGDRDFLMNQERFLKHLMSFTLPPQGHLKVKYPILSWSVNDKSLFGLICVIFVQFVRVLRFKHFDSATHFILSCLLWWCFESVKSLVMAPAQALLNNWADTFHSNMLNTQSDWELTDVSFDECRTVRCNSHKNSQHNSCGFLLLSRRLQSRRNCLRCPLFHKYRPS